MTQENGYKRWAAWLAPAVILGMCSGAFSMGLYVGEGRVAVELAALEERVHNHIGTPKHSGALSAEQLAVEFREINRRLDRIEMRLEER